MKRKQERVRAGRGWRGMNGRGPQDAAWSARSRPAPLPTHWLGPCSGPGTRADSVQQPRATILAKISSCSGGGEVVLPGDRRGGVRVELDWEDCIAEGQQEPARGVGGAPSPFNRESLFLTASPLD